MLNNTDRELVNMAQNGNVDAEEALMRKYKDTVKIKAKMYYMAGAELDDIVQEGMIGLLKAIRKYDGDKDTSFGTYAGICITSQIIDAIRTADRDKHKALNTSISLSKPIEQENENITLADTLKATSVETPEAMLVIKDVVYYILHNGGDIFSDFEMKVLNEYIKGNKSEIIAGKLGKNTKSIDNAVQRIKRKIEKYLWG